MLLANSAWAPGYERFWHDVWHINGLGHGFAPSPHFIVNDVLMVVFFFVVGLELRVELAHGVLSEWRRALLPAGAALGGMLVPAALYLLVASAPGLRAGWGVPIATDIAFALG